MSSIFWGSLIGSVIGFLTVNNKSRAKKIFIKSNDISQQATRLYRNVRKSIK